MIIIFTILFYALYQTPFLLLALVGGFSSAKIIHSIITFEKVLNLPPSLLFLYRIISRKWCIFYKIILSVITFQAIFCLTCFGNIFYQLHIEDLLLNSLLVPFKLPWLITTISAPIRCFGGLLFLPYCLIFAYYYLKQSRKTLFANAVAVSSGIICALLLPVNKEVSIFNLQIKSEYFLLSGVIALFLILAQNKNISHIIYATVLLTTVYCCQYNILPMINSAFPPSPTNSAHFTLSVNTPNYIHSNNSYLDKFRLMHNTENEANTELLSIQTNGNFDKSKAMVKFASYNNYDGVNLTQSSPFHQSTIASNYDILNLPNDDNIDNITVNLKHYNSAFLPTIITTTQSLSNIRSSKIQSKTNNIQIINSNQKLSLENNLYFNDFEQTIYSEHTISDIQYIINLKSVEDLDIQAIDKQIINTAKISDSNELNYFKQWINAEVTKYANIQKKSEQFAKIFADLMHYSHLSYSLLEPSGENSWKPNNDFYFASTPSGYNAKQLDVQIFAPIMRGHPLCKRDNNKTPCALAFGDDLQFAVAGYLIASKLNLDPIISVGATLPDDNIIRGKDIAIWLEIDANDKDNERQIFFTKPRTDNSVPPQTGQNTWMTYAINIINNNQAENILPHKYDALEGATNQEVKAENTNSTSKISIPFNIIFYSFMIITLLFLPLLLTNIKLKIRKALLREHSFIDSAALCWQFFIIDYKHLSNQDYSDSYTREKVVQKIVYNESKYSHHLLNNISNFANTVNSYCFASKHHFARNDCNTLTNKLSKLHNKIINDLHDENIKLSNNTAHKIRIALKTMLIKCRFGWDLYQLLHIYFYQTKIFLKNGLYFKHGRRKPKHISNQLR